MSRAISNWIVWRCFDLKYGKTVEEREWIKVHVACGVKTNVVTTVENLDKNVGDAPVLPTWVRATARNFAAKEVSADSAYSSGANMEAIADLGATPYIAFKDNATGGLGGLFGKMFHFYSFKGTSSLSIITSVQTWNPHSR